MPAPGTSGKMPVSKNTVTGVFWVMANTRVRMVSGMTASREAVAAPGACKQNGKTQRACRGQKKLRGQLADLCSCKGHHTTTTPVSTVYSRSTRPVPMAMLAAMSKASIMRMVPER